MARFMPLRVSLPLLACCVGVSAESEPRVRSDLDDVRARLEATAREIARAHDERDTHTEALARSEKQAARLRGELTRLDARVAEAQQRAVEARRVVVATHAELAERRRRLARVVRASYRFVRRDPLAMLLDLKSPLDVDRLLGYDSVIRRTHAEKIREIAGAVTELEAQETRVTEEAAAVVALRGEKQRRLAELETQRAARADAVRALAERIRDGKSRAARLRDDEGRLMELTDALRASLPDTSLALPDHRPFAELRGKLPWPVRGPLLATYGKARGASDLTWRGVLIGAPAGAAVRSIHRGRVAYGDWLRGFGLLLIIEHDGGFMSLYGHNGTLARETGDWVESGEVIATVGDSGGISEPALYFEIRRAGSPVNPGRWCAGGATAKLVSPWRRRVFSPRARSPSPRGHIRDQS